MTISKRPLLALGALGAFAAFSLASACNLVIDGSATSCVDDADCSNFKNFGCNLETNECETLDKCSSNEACADGEVCRFPSPRTCVPIRQGECQEIYPDDDTYRGDNAMLIGLSSPLTVEASTGQSIANGAKLAVKEFNEQGGVEGTRPLVLVLCDDHGEAVDAYENGLSLANIGVQAMIGPAYSGQTVETAGTSEKPGTVANNVLLISPSATSTLITGFPDDSPRCIEDCAGDEACIGACPGLVWRTSPSDEFQGAGLAAYFADIETAIKNRGGVSRPSIVVHVLSKPDAYGKFLSEGIRLKLVFNGDPATQQQNTNPPKFKAQEYADADEADGVQPAAVDIDPSIEAMPDAVFIIGTSEVGDIIEKFENDWPGNDSDRPFYILADGGLGTAVTEQVLALPGNVPARIRGSVPGPVESDIYDSFSGSYGIEFMDAVDGGAEIFGAAGAYDIVYMLAYSSIAARGKPLTAEQLARGFSSLVQAEEGEMPIKAGLNDVGRAQGTLGDAGTIDFDGASGTLDFDLDSGEAPSAIQIWCIDPNAGDGESGENAGIYYDAGEVFGADEDPATYAAPQPPFTCPFNTCGVDADCLNHPYGQRCLTSGPNEGFCGCTAATQMTGCPVSMDCGNSDRCTP